MSDEQAETKIEPYYQAHAKYFVDALFDKGIFSDDLSRDGMQTIEDMLALLFQQQAQSAARCAQFAKQFKDRGTDDRAQWEEKWRQAIKGAWDEVKVLQDQLTEITGRFMEAQNEIDLLNTVRKSQGVMIGRLHQEKLLQDQTIQFQGDEIIALEEKVQIFEAGQQAEIAPEQDLSGKR